MRWLPSLFVDVLDWNFRNRLFWHKKKNLTHLKNNVRILRLVIFFQKTSMFEISDLNYDKFML